MKGKLRAVTIDGWFLLRYSWEEGESRHSVEYKMLENLPPERVAFELEGFAALLRQKTTEPFSYSE